MTRASDVRDAQIHGAIDKLAHQIAATFGLTWRETLTRMVAFSENDEESPVYALAPPPAPRRKRRSDALSVRA